MYNSEPYLIHGVFDSCSMKWEAYHREADPTSYTIGHKEVLVVRYMSSTYPQNVFDSPFSIEICPCLNGMFKALPRRF